MPKKQHHEDIVDQKVKRHVQFQRRYRGKDSMNGRVIRIGIAVHPELSDDGSGEEK